jgi:hypothetical protein
MTVQRVVDYSDTLAQTLSPVVNKPLSVGILTFRPSVQTPAGKYMRPIQLVRPPYVKISKS